MAFKIGEIPPDKKRDWKVSIDGHEQQPGMVEVSSRFGTFTYGWGPEGYDRVAFRWRDGGGVVTIPYTRTPEGELLIGLLLEKHANMGDKPVWCAIGGCVEPGETHHQAQAREAAEAVNYETPQTH